MESLQGNIDNLIGVPDEEGKTTIYLNGGRI